MNLSNTQGSWQSELYASKMQATTCRILLSTNMTGYRQLYRANFTLSETANRYTRYFSSHSQEEENTLRGGQPQTADNATQASTNSSKVPSNSATYALFIKGIILLVFYLLCLKIGQISFFYDLLTRCGFSLGGRALSVFLINKGLYAAAILFSVRALLATEEEPASIFGKHVSPGGEIASSSYDKPNLPDLNLPATDEERQNEKSKTALAEEAVSFLKWDEVGHSKKELALLISPMIEEEAAKYQTQKPAPSPQEMVEWLIKRSGSKDAKGANRPGATLKQYKALLTWLSRAHISAEGDISRARINISSEMKSILSEYYK